MAVCSNKKCSLSECDQPETCAAYVPVLTRADKILAMSDEEITEFVVERCTIFGGSFNEQKRKNLCGGMIDGTI